MNVKRKTVRFQDSLSDLAVYDAISDYKKYGYRSESHMVIEAVRRLIKDGASELDPDTLADKIAERLAGKLTVSTSAEPIPTNEDAPSTDAAFDATKPKAQIILDVLSSILATQMPCRSRRSGA